MDYRKLAEQLIVYILHCPKRPKSPTLVENSRGENLTLAYLLEIQNNVAPGQIASFEDVSTARMACIINKLEEKGLAVRKTDESDKRKTIIALTDKGRKSTLQHRESMLNNLSSILDYLGEKDATEYVRIMKRLYLYNNEKENTNA